MNDELLDLIRRTGYLSDANLSAQQRFDLLTRSFWHQAAELGYNLPALKRTLWVAADRPESFLIGLLPEAQIQKAVKATGKEPDPRKRIKETAALIAALYLRGEKEIQASISRNMDRPDVMRAETGRIRRALLLNAQNWLGLAVPGLYLAGSKIGMLTGPHAKAANALAIQELNRFKDVDQTIGRHVEEVIAEAEKRRAKAALSQTKADYTGLRGGVTAFKTIDGKELSLGSYVQMLAITAARDFFNEGSLNSILGRGNDLALISREVRSNSCKVCRKWAGKIVSISGKSNEYPALDTAIDEGLLHPHCIHTLTAIDYPGST
jgi:hypothetical protein